ncbi:class I SAM-dependent methyltransferase [Bacteroidales bacterium OttesenSCG-928-L03]|nr:class I SAM-dependent methyltransferase [Bacteroidales bacterium OttesenSCG-928-L03]
MKSTRDLQDKIQSIDLESLPISEYNKKYIRRIRPTLAHYVSIYRFCLTEGMKNYNKPLSEITLVDYGGGSGFLSMFLKQQGVGRVVYVDFNPDSVFTAQRLKEEVGLGADVFLCGDSATLLSWCRDNQTQPDMLISTDVIEHIYCLDSFFADLHRINNRMRLVFTTGSNPYNPMKKRALRQIMVEDESGTKYGESFYSQRLRFIQNEFPILSEEEAYYWAENTRGLVFEDVRKAVEMNQPKPLQDKYNTCDPKTGSWTERILPIADYKRLAESYNYHLKVKNGFFYPYNGGMIKKILSLSGNVFLKAAGRLGLPVAPFILLKYVTN